MNDHLPKKKQQKTIKHLYFFLLNTMLFIIYNVTQFNVFIISLNNLPNKHVAVLYMVLIESNNSSGCKHKIKFMKQKLRAVVLTRKVNLLKVFFCCQTFTDRTTRTIKFQCILQVMLLRNRVKSLKRLSHVMY